MLVLSKDGKKIFFTPPEKSTEQELEFDLVYGHRCPKCNNLVQALFMTDKKIDPKPWEEIMTRQLDKDGYFKRIIPGRHERFRSHYNIQTIGRGNAVSAELIRLTEHFERKEDVVNGNVCEFTVLSSVIPEYRVHDMLLANFLNPSEYIVTDKDYEDIKQRISNNYAGKDLYCFVPAIGEGPEVVFMHRNSWAWLMQEATNKYRKPYQPPVSIF